MAMTPFERLTKYRSLNQRVDLTVDKTTYDKWELLVEYFKHKGYQDPKRKQVTKKFVFTSLVRNKYNELSKSDPEFKELVKSKKEISARKLAD